MQPCPESWTASLKAERFGGRGREECSDFPRATPRRSGGPAHGGRAGRGEDSVAQREPGALKYAVGITGGISRCGLTRRVGQNELAAIIRRSHDGSVTIGVPGQQAEDYARRLAGDLGVRDFVYRPVVIKKGKGVREISDGLLVAGSEGLIIQVKSREPEAAASDAPAKAEAWCTKNAAAAVRQADGTRRSLKGGKVAVRSLRGFERTLPDASMWASVIIIDHPGDPQVMLPPAPNTIYISVNDWRNLHRWLRSTWGVISYVRRAIDSGVKPALGSEQDRYAILTEADLRAPGSLTSFPTLPPYPIDGTEARDAALFEDLIERVADAEGATGWDAEQYLWIVEELDRITPIARVRLGAKMREAYLEIRSTRSRRSFLAHDPGNPRTRIAFLYQYDASDDPAGDWFKAQVAAYGTLRNQHALEAGADPSSITLAIGVLHHPDRGRRYVFFYVTKSDVTLPDELRQDLEAEFGVFDGTTVRSPESEGSQTKSPATQQPAGG